MKIFYLLSFAILLCGCKKYKDGDPTPKMSDTPAISLHSVSHSTIHQYSDTIQFVIKYEDGNGDLGHPHADSTTLVVTDLRFPITMHFHVPPLTPAGSDLSITGLLPVTVSGIILKDQSSVSETAAFAIRLRDRSGFWSNTVTTQGIIILP